jgi:hypothetical protein
LEEDRTMHAVRRLFIFAALPAVCILLTISCSNDSTVGRAEDDMRPRIFRAILEISSVDLEKATNGVDADAAPGPEIAEGETVTWTYTVTNSGAFPLDNVTVTDDMGVAVSCPKTSLAPGESMVCTGVGTAVSGQYENLGTVVAFDDIGDRVSDEDLSHYFGIPNEPGGGEGCTLGYWKNHLSMWPPTGYTAEQPVHSVFAEASAYPDLAGKSLLHALRFGGGPGAKGAAMILLKQAVAALLNASHPDVSYARAACDVIDDVNAALASGDRAAMIDLAEALDADNQSGCPF